MKSPEPFLYECLSSTFLQSYPRHKLIIFFCVSSRDDPSLPILEQLLQDHPGFDARILVEDEDPNLSDGRNLGPNPKIRNMSRAYREARGDIIWILDCNVWVGRDVAGRMVDLLCGFTSPTLSNTSGSVKKYKFVHQLPLVTEMRGALQSASSMLTEGGAALEELFLSTSHAKFYTAINTVAIAPCIIGKSNMFRRSHLNALTSDNSSSSQQGIDHFSSNICEDHLLAALLWTSPVPSSVLTSSALEGADPLSKPPTKTATTATSKSWGNHALLPPHPSNIAIQPLTHSSLTSYLSRRTRWLRVRKFTVTAATLVEPGTESLLCSTYGAYALTTLPKFRSWGIGETWMSFLLLWMIMVGAWAVVDYWVWSMLQDWNPAASADDEDEDEEGRLRRRGKVGKGRWVMAWLGREVLAFPIWLWAFWGGVSVVWRGRKFSVGVDMKVTDIGPVEVEDGKRKEL